MYDILCYEMWMLHSIMHNPVALQYCLKGLYLHAYKPLWFIAVRSFVGTIDTIFCPLNYMSIFEASDFKYICYKKCVFTWSFFKEPKKILRFSLVNDRWFSKVYWSFYHRWHNIVGLSEVVPSNVKRKKEDISHDHVVLQLILINIVEFT